MANIEVLDGYLFAKLAKCGAANLNKNKETVNDLNVFPIPDGDTGDNMFMTIDSGVKNISENESLELVSSTLAKGMLFGARGNSGVILSRIFSGISKGLAGYQVINLNTFSTAMQRGVEEAYASVKVPVEGTILTVYREAVAFANKTIDENSTFDYYFELLLKEIKASLERTPELLKVLKDAGVVDSGGAGLYYIIEGMDKALLGDEIEYTSTTENAKEELDYSLFNENSILEFGYCTEFLLQLTNQKVNDVNTFDESVIVKYLESVGESVVAFREGSIVKVHVHTMTPGVILNEVQQYGEFLKIKIENMTLQHNEVTKKEEQKEPLFKKAKKKIGVVAVASGAGIKNMFLESGVDYVIEGGQSSNPCAEDFVKAFDEVNAENIFVYPNNGNIILTANQASSLYNQSNIIIIPSKNIGQCYGTLSCIDVEQDVETIENNIKESIGQIKTAQVSIASRDTEMNGVQVISGKYIGFVGDTILTCKDTPNEALFDLCEKLEVAKEDVMILIYGKESTDDDANTANDTLTKLYRRTEIALVKGEQPVFNYTMITGLY